MEIGFAIAIIVFIVLVRFKFLRDGIDHPFHSFMYNRVIYRNPISSDDYIRINLILEKEIEYYRSLSNQQRARFIRRIFDFRTQTKFVGMDGLKVTEEMELVISAGAVQLTFWLQHYALDFLKRIHVYPAAFFHKGINKRIKGGAVPNGVVMLSWPDILEGFADPDDRINLALHEMAHVLKLSVFHGKEFDKMFKEYIHEWLDISQAEFDRMQKGNESTLRRYAGVNMHEFFAVSVEHFFEDPEDFCQQLPDIYNHLCVLLNQNPLNKMGDYVYDEEFAQKVNSESARIPIPVWQKVRA